MGLRQRKKRERTMKHVQVEIGQRKKKRKKKRKKTEKWGRAGESSGVSVGELFGIL